MSEKIDFVILWVDGNDSKWKADKEKYSKSISKDDISNQENRYRDWDLLKYWFRGVEKYAPWVNKIHFVTYGHLPEWLDTSNPKLNIVKHEDFIPKEYLPTFNSNVIQYYLNRIPGLAEKFVMFDDDQYIINTVKSTDFFVGDKVCEVYGEDVIRTSTPGDYFPFTMMNNIQYINKYYSKKDVYAKGFSKYISLKFGLKNIVRTIFLKNYPDFVGLFNPHICQAYTKTYYEKFWEMCGDVLTKASNNKFRTKEDLTTYFVRYLQLLDGNFVPRTKKFGNRIELTNKGCNKIDDYITNKKCKIFCINDTDTTIDFEKTKEKLIEIFERNLPNKSKFEK